MEGPRMAALALHGLNAADRDWLLANLPPGDRGRLAPLLAELAEIGMSRETARTQSRIAALPVRVEPAVPDTPLERLRRASADEIFTALDHEPAALVAACVQADDWTWRNAVVARLDPQRRAEVADLLRDHASVGQAPRMRETLLVKLDARVRGRVTANKKDAVLVALRRWLEARWKTK